VKTLLFWIVTFAVFFGGAIFFMTSMPGEPHSGAMPALSDDERTIADRLSGCVETIGRDYGSRGTHQPQALDDTATYLHSALRKAGYDVHESNVESKIGTLHTLECTQLGTRSADEFIVVGAHYDCEARSPGSDSNASGCAVLVEIARLVKDTANERSVKFLLFPTGSGAHASDEKSAAAIYAREMRTKHEKVVVMLSLDGLGYYRDTPASQSVPFPFGLVYPDTGNFVAFIGDLESREVTRKAVELFRFSAKFPSQGIAVPGFMPDFECSDHAGFRHQGFPAILVTDTGTLRYPQSGTSFDTNDRLDYEKMARVTTGLARVVTGLAKKTSLL
jgi:hypothetical protein